MDAGDAVGIRDAVAIGEVGDAFDSGELPELHAERLRITTTPSAADARLMGMGRFRDK
ncbi:MAG: hypothetical protein ABIU87_02080 [Ornithinibacter sp.]